MAASIGLAQDGFTLTRGDVDVLNVGTAEFREQSNVAAFYQGPIADAVIAASVTYTINDDFGAKVIAGDTGFFLNDEMDDFTAKPGAANQFGLVQGKANAIAPGKRPLRGSAAAP